MSFVPFVLRVHSGPLSGRHFLLPSSQQVVVGRSLSCDCSVPWDLHVSARHFRIEAESGNYTIVDLGSRNGTFINGQRVEKSTLKDGDVIVAGTTLFSLRILKEEESVDEGETLSAPFLDEPQSSAIEDVPIDVPVGDRETLPL